MTGEPPIVPSAAPAPPAPGPVPAPLPPPPAARSRRWIAVVVAVVIVVVVVVAALEVSGAFRSGSSSSAGWTYAESRGSAASVASSAAGGPWSLLIAVGLTTPSPFSASVANATTSVGAITQSDCVIQPAVGAPTVIALAGISNVSRGDAGVWLYVYSNASGGILTVTAQGSGASVLATVSGSQCDLAGFGLQPVPSTGVIDSAAAAADAGAAGGYLFLSQNPQANATYVLTGGVNVLGTSTGPLWAVSFTDCAPSGQGGPASAPTFLSVISATTGTPIESSSRTTSCAAPTSHPIAGAVSLGRPAEANQGTDYWYNFTVESATGIVWDDTALTVQTSSGAPVGLPAGSLFTVLSVAGNPLATYAPATGSWTSGGTTTIAASQELSLFTSSAFFGQDLDLEITGVGTFSGSTSVSIP